MVVVQTSMAVVGSVVAYQIVTGTSHSWGKPVY